MDVPYVQPGTPISFKYLSAACAQGFRKDLGSVMVGLLMVARIEIHAAGKARDANSRVPVAPRMATTSSRMMLNP